MNEIKVPKTTWVLAALMIALVAITIPATFVMYRQAQEIKSLESQIEMLRRIETSADTPAEHEPVMTLPENTGVIDAGRIPPSTFFHVPPKGCPPGTERIPEYFFYSDSTKHPADACYNPNGDGSLDTLFPGEGARLAVGIPQ